MIDQEASKYCTVDEVIAILQEVSDAGKGDYTVGCNDEYYLARKHERPRIHDESKSVDLGGYV